MAKDNKVYRELGESRASANQRQATRERLLEGMAKRRGLNAYAAKIQQDPQTYNAIKAGLECINELGVWTEYGENQFICVRTGDIVDEEAKNNSLSKIGTAFGKLEHLAKGNDRPSNTRKDNYGEPRTIPGRKNKICHVQFTIVLEEFANLCEACKLKVRQDLQKQIDVLRKPKETARNNVR